MPDGDRVHSRLPRPYQNVYKQICEGQFDCESLADEVVQVIKHQLQQVGDKPVHLMSQIASRLTTIPNEPLLKGIVDWTARGREIDKLIAQADVPKRISEHIAEASKELLYDMRTGPAISKTNVQLIERMLNRFYRAEFEERVPIVQHYKGTSEQFVQMRLDEMRPLVKQKVAYLARQAAKRTSFERLRRPPITKPKINLHETDVLSLN